MITYLDNQLIAIAKLKQYKVGALFMQPGSGKTLTALELIRSAANIDYVLWLTPFQTIDNLRNELSKWNATDIDVYGIESLSSSDRLYFELQKNLSNTSNAFIVVDESLKIKNWEAKRTQRIIQLSRLAKYKLILNGTPISRNILDIWAQMEFLSPHILNMRIAEFKSTFCEWKKMTTYNGNKAQSREWIVKYHNIDYLYSLIQHYVYESDLQLNLKRQYITVDYNIDASELCEYQRLKQYYLQAELMQEKGNTIFMEMTTKMQQSYSTCKSKMHALRSIITSHHIEKILVYCKYISSADAVTKQFPSVRVMTYGKHSYGLNLQDYNVIIYYDRTWDYAQRLQSERRIFRTGQINDCTYYTMNGNVPLEKLIATNINRKIDILNHLKKLSIEQINKII